jgi:hypothetical protein
LSALLVLFGLAAAAAGTFLLGRSWRALEQVSASGDPPFAPLNLPPQTVNGITAQIESYYADANRLSFVVHINGEADDYFLGNISFTEANVEISDGGGVSRLSSDTPIFAVDLVTASPVTSDRLNGQLAFDVVTPDGEDTHLANFQFDLDLAISPGLIFNPKQSISANGVEILLDRVVMTPEFTQVYLCYVPPTGADWGLDSGTRLRVNSQTGGMQTYNLLFDKELSDGSIGSEPGWTPPVKEGRCIKIGFQVGDAHPISITLTIPALEQTIPEVIPEKDLAAAYKKLKAEGIDMEWRIVDHGAYAEYKKLPAGMTQNEAFHQFAQALGYVYPGEWVFEVQLDPQGGIE